MNDHGIDERDLTARLAVLGGAIPVPGPSELGRMARAATIGDTGRRRSHVRLRMGIAALAVAALVAAVFAIEGVVGRPAPAAAGVRFSHRGGFIVARITDPAASAAALQAAFAKHGLDIHLSLLPVSPSLVGTVIYIGENGNGITAIQGGRCVTGGGGCPIGLRIPSRYRGEAYISLGRAANGDEAYDSTASAFAPGEPFHCSGLIGAPVRAARRAFAARGYSAEWTLHDATTGARLDPAAIGADVVVDADHMGRHRLLVSVSKTPLQDLQDPGLAGYLARLAHGC